MCGISGIYGLEGLEDPKSILIKMTEALAHRGPDAQGIHFNEHLGMGHRRLSIIDTSSDGNQPFHSADGMYSLVFNGELYNYLELKEKLKEYPFQTKTDTEVVLAALQTWGDQALQRFNGMFAFAFWDHHKKELKLVRDRLGIKPLYVSSVGSHFLFASEIRSILASELVERKLSPEGLADYLRYQTVHGEHTIIEGIQQIPAGGMLVIREEEQQFVDYWNLCQAANLDAGNQNREQQKKDIRTLLTESVQLRMRADVPFGAFLSGGIDSSAIVGLMAEVSDQSIATFNISFKENEFSEAPYARAIAQKFNTDHHEIELSVDAFKSMIPDALDAMDHPSGDGPNTYVVSKVTKEAGITMALSGLGGDELFAGYSIFTQSASLLSKRWLMSFPPLIRGMGGDLMKLLKPSVASSKMAGILKEDYLDLEHVYPWSRSIFEDQKIQKLLRQKNLPENAVKRQLLESFQAKSRGANLPFLSKVSVAEIQSYMRHVLLRDSDQMSMAHALEVRVPFLDHRLVAYVLGVNDTNKYPHTPKELLVDSLGDLLPREIVDRPKMGFTLPWELWMKGDLKDFCAENMEALSKREAFNEREVLQLWKDFLHGKPGITWSRIWPLVVLNYWMNKNNIE